ncbi:MAG: hypothetical protein C4575_10835 [Desulforudis sp.]|nr:MAG: hypothetical protein C4575_10835 [Desulforudis sp.]
MKYPFEVSFSEILSDPDPFVSAVFSCLESEFLVMPKGMGFVEYDVFEQGYEHLKRVTHGFSDLDVKTVMTAVIEVPIVLIVLRSILGITPPEWGYMTTQRTRTEVTQGYVRSLDRSIRMAPFQALKITPLSARRLEALVGTACQLLGTPIPSVGEERIHRLDKADTGNGIHGVQSLSRVGVPYAMLLYERFLGRPFAGHRDSVSELVGDSLESAIEEVLASAGISYRKTKRAERVRDFDQAPDFIIPSEFSPRIIIEAKITEDDGTARDKVTRVQHLGALSIKGRSPDNPRFEVIACIGGRGFGVRREDMRKLLLATRGKVFTQRTLGQLVECTRLREYRTR